MSGQPDNDCNSSYQLAHDKSPLSFVSKLQPGRVVGMSPAFLGAFVRLTSRELLHYGPSTFPLQCTSYDGHEALDCLDHAKPISHLHEPRRYVGWVARIDGIALCPRQRIHQSPRLFFVPASRPEYVLPRPATATC